MESFFRENDRQWKQLQEVVNHSFVCGYCDLRVSSNRGYPVISRGSGQQVAGVHICPNCGGPTFVTEYGKQHPQSALGNSVSNVPSDLDELYNEARQCTSKGCYTGAVLLCRKMLMNISVEQGAKEGKRFVDYVNYLSENGYTPPNGKHWVDHIRKKGNEATHEIAVMSETDAKELMSFTEMLLRFIYEFPSMIPQPTDKK